MNPLWKEIVELRDRVDHLERQNEGQPPEQGLEFKLAEMRHNRDQWKRIAEENEAKAQGRADQRNQLLAAIDRIKQILEEI